jgi:hypothetical protein
MQYDSPVAIARREPEASAMKLRIISAVLWFLAGWGVAGTIAINFGLNQAIGLLVGIAWAALIIIDPKDVVWRVGKGSPNSRRGLRSRGAAVRPQVGAGS